MDEVWKPFATAPKDGTPILVWVADEQCSDISGFDLIWFDKGWLWGGADDFPGKPTHWRHLPAPPIFR